MTDSPDNKWLLRVGLLLLVLLLIGLRLGYFIQVRHYPGFARFLPPDDQAYYHQTASRIASGHLLAVPGAMPRGPGYVYFLGAIYRLFPGEGRTALAIQGGLGVLTGLLIFLLGRRLFSVPAALTAALFYALYLPSLCYEGALLMAALVTFLLTAGLYCLVRGRQEDSPLFLILSGLCYGWAFLCRPNNLIFLLFGVLLLMRRPGAKRGLLPFAVPAVSLYALFIIRNHFAGGGLFTLSTQGRRVMMNSQFHQAAGIGWQWQDNWEKILSGLPDGFMPFALFLIRDIAEHWTEWLALNMAKLYAFFFNYEFSQFIDFYTLQEIIPLLRLPGISLGILSPLVVIGLFLLFRDRDRACHRTLALYFIAGVFSVTVFYILSRLRLPLIPLFCLISAYALWRLPPLFRHESKTVKILLAAVLLLAAWGLNAGFMNDRYASRFMPTAVYNRGVYYAEQRQYARAAEDFQRVLNAIPRERNAGVHDHIARQLARCYDQAGQPDRAAAIRNRLKRLRPDTGERRTSGPPGQ